MKTPSPVLVYQYFDVSIRLELVNSFLDADQLQRLTDDEIRYVKFYRGQLVCMEHVLAKRIELAGGMPQGNDLKKSVLAGLEEQIKTINGQLSKLSVG